jgi:hypothetical protein
MWTVRASAAALAIALALDGCGPGTHAIQLGWSFADGRRCADAGVVGVTLASPATCDGDGGSTITCSFACEDGELGRLVDAHVGGKDPIAITAVTPSGTPLYRGRIDPGAASPVTVTLYFTGGQ